MSLDLMITSGCPVTDTCADCGAAGAELLWVIAEGVPLHCRLRCAGCAEKPLLYNLVEAVVTHVDHCGGEADDAIAALIEHGWVLDESVDLLRPPPVAP